MRCADNTLVLIDEKVKKPRKGLCFSLIIKSGDDAHIFTVSYTKYL